MNGALHVTERGDRWAAVLAVSGFVQNNFITSCHRFYRVILHSPSSALRWGCAPRCWALLARLEPGAPAFEEDPSASDLGCGSRGALDAHIVLADCGQKFGRWDLLRREVRAYSVVAAEYEQSHGRIQSKADARRFYAFHPVIHFDLEPPEEPVDIVYLWWREPARVGIVYGRGGTAAFELDTMFCVYSD